VHCFLARYASGADMHVASAAMKALMQYDWPGNVRELENCVERAVALGNGQVIDLGDLPPAIASRVNIPSGPVIEAASAHGNGHGAAIGKEVLDPDLAGDMTFAEPSTEPLSSTDLEDIERATIQRVFEQVKGDKALAGRMLGISRATLYRKLKRYNIGAGAPTSSHALQ
jgi:DNA-binding NtrC family response regulator